ncbi:MAG: YbjN domain-containing protein [Cyanobacteria bacterium J06648_16]
MNFTNAAQELSYTRVRDYLISSSFQDRLRMDANRPHFDLIHLSETHIEVDILPWEHHPYPERELAVVRASSCVTVGSGPELALMRFLLETNRKTRFGSFQTDETGAIFFAHRILGGDHMDLVELETCILAVAAIATEYEPIITTQFGGQRARGDRLANLT